MKNLIKKLVLGTVQFGLDYGVNNSTGKPTRKESLAMLDLAFKKGIWIFDTAYAYGQAEKILGEFSRGRNLNGKIRIITKTKEGTEKAIVAGLKESLSRLRSDYVDGCLLHAPELIRDDKIVAVLTDLKERGLVKNIGVSIYDEADAMYASKLEEIDYIQVPYNIFDQRMEKSGFFSLAKKNGKTVFARSAFLQGLLLMEEEKIPSYLKGARIHIRNLDEIINKHGLTRIQSALLFCLSNNDVNYVVFGVDNIKQLTEIVDLAEIPPNYQACVNELKNKFSEMEKNIISPNLWKS